MFTIDLLKGQALPLRSSPAGTAIAVITVTVPIIVAIATLGFYLGNEITASIKEREIGRWQAKVDKLSDSVELQESLEKEKTVYAECLSEVKFSIGRYTQWSPVLTTLVENMPDSVVLAGLEVEQHSVKRKIPKKGDPEKTIDVEIPVRTLRISMSGSALYDSNKAVRDFRNRLWSSAFLGPKLENIRVSERHEMLEGRDVVSYEIDCVFKSEL